MIGKIQRVPLREVWKHEEKDFTPWLQDHIDILNEVIGLDLAGPEREQSAGDFSVDLVAEDGSGNLVIIENQLGKSDHDHLGKLITYLTAIEAKTAIWIVADPKPEHVASITWLNESSSASFYMLKVEAIKIGDSPPAPLLTLIVGPSEEGREVGKTKKEFAEGDGLRKNFWTGLLERANKKTKLHSTISPGQDYFIGTSSGKRGLIFNYHISQHKAQVELYIDRGKETEQENKSIFDSLEKSKKEIEEVFGEPLKWQKVEGQRACMIRKMLTVGGYGDESTKWPEIHDAMIDAMIRLEKALRPYIENLKV